MSSQRPTTRAFAALGALALVGIVPASGTAQDAARLDDERLDDARPVEAAVVPIAAGEFLAFFADADDVAQQVPAFRIDTLLVTRGRFASFVAEHPEWGPGRPPVIFAGPRYLEWWPSDGVLPAASEDLAATHVSWFAAREFCEAQGGRLPTEAEWERVGAASADATDAAGDPAHTREVLAGYERAGSAVHEPVGQRPPNAWGVFDMHGLVWEWVEDYGASVVSGGRRGTDDALLGFFCGGAALSARDASDYAAFMRYAFRSSLSPSYAARTLGFRCAYDGT